METFKPEFIFNMDETRLFQICFQSVRSLCPGENKMLLRGKNDMGAKDRFSAFVFAVATVSLELPMAIIRKSSNRRYFRTGHHAVP